MGGWTCADRDTISWDGNIRAKKFEGDGSLLTNLPQQDLSNYPTKAEVAASYALLTEFNYGKYDYLNLEVYENDFTDISHVQFTSGTIAKSNIEQTAYYLQPGNAVGNDAQIFFFGTGSGTGTTTNTTNTHSNKLKEFYYKGRWSFDDTTWRGQVVIGHSTSSSANDLNTLTHGVGFIYGSSGALLSDGGLYGFTMSGAGTLTLTAASAAIVKNTQFEVLCQSDASTVRNGTASSFAYYYRAITNGTIGAWTLLGTINSNIPGNCSNFGMWAETEMTSTGLNRLAVDYTHVIHTRDYYVQT